MGVESVSDSSVCTWDPFPPTGLHTLVYPVRLHSVDIPGRRALFYFLKENRT